AKARPGTASGERDQGEEPALTTPEPLHLPYDTLTVAGREVFETCVACSSVVAKGMEILGREMTGYVHASLEDGAAAARDLMTVHSLRDAIDVQADYARRTLERMVDETARLTELSLTLTSELVGPVQTRAVRSAQTLFGSFSR
ncbi:MAG: phasin family protein, partial [Alphaproteobacteria bacterium]